MKPPSRSARFLAISAVCVLVGIALCRSRIAHAEPAKNGEPGGEPGFVSIFNGKDLTGWDGDPRLWSVHDGVLRGETGPDKPAAHNTFLIWREQKPRDFILKLKFHIREGNSGVQFRSRDEGDWTVTGYQAEVANDRPDPGIGSGFVFDEHGPRGHLALVGDFVYVDAVGKHHLIGKVGDALALKAAHYYNNDDWNDCTIAAHGNRIRVWVNGYQIVELIDSDAKRLTEGIIALQLHAGTPTFVEFKEMRLRTLDADLPPEGRQFNRDGESSWVTGVEAEK